MNLTISLLHLEHTESIDQKIKEKSEKFDKFFPKGCDIKWTCHVKNGEHFAECKIIGPRSQFLASAKTDSLYKTLDKVVLKLEKQIQKHKELSKERIKKHDEKVFLDPEHAWSEYDDDLEGENFDEAS